MKTDLTVFIQIWLYLYRFDCLYTDLTVFIQIWLYLYRFDYLYTDLTIDTDLTGQIYIKKQSNLYKKAVKSVYKYSQICINTVKSVNSQICINSKICINQICI
jgi:hypothetical protein